MDSIETAPVPITPVTLINMKKRTSTADIGVGFKVSNDDKGTDNPAFIGEQEFAKTVCTKCQVETTLNDVPILTNDRPYTIEIYDCADQKKIEVLRINLSNDKNKSSSRIEMGSKVKHNQIEPLNENSILKSDQVKSIKYLEERDAPDPDLTNGDEEHDRQEWSNPIEFLLSCVAMSVGLGNVWRFPFTAYENGGGAFLIPYLLVLFLIGRPLYFLELSMGQFASKNSVKVWDMAPGFRGVGYGQAIANSAVLSYYTCLIALAVYYLFASCQSVLPWTVCDPDIKLPDTICIDSGGNATEYLINNSLPLDTQVIGSAEQYFLHGVLKENPDISGGIGLPDLQLMGCLAFCYIVMFVILCKGAQGAGKAAYFTALFPYVVLFTLLVRGVTLPGAMKGIMFYITPQWGELLNIKVWYAAVTQSFFSLSVGFGALFTYASYNGFSHNVYRDAVIISITDTFTSFLAGFTIFAVLGNLATELNVPVSKVIKSGTGLAFISYPMAIAKFDYVPQLFAVLFFLMLCTLGMGSSTGLMSAINAIIADSNPNWNHTYVSAATCLTGFLIGLVYITPGGQAVLNLVDFYGGSFMVFALAVLEVAAISYVYGMKNVLRDIKFMLNIDLGIYWKFCWGFFIPVSLSFFFIYFCYEYEPIKYAGIAYPDMAIYAGYGLMALAIVQVPLWLLREFCRSPESSLWQKLKSLFKPNDSWGPGRGKDRLEWTRFITDEEIKDVLK